MKTNILFTLFLAISFFTFSQRNEDYYQKIIDTTKNKELKLASLDSLIHNVRNQKDLKKFADRTEQFVDLALDLERFDDAIKKTIRGFYNINTALGQRDRALRLIEKVEKFLDKTTDTYLKGGLYLKKGGGYYNGKNFNEAIKYYTLAIKNYGIKDSIYKADAIFFRGLANFDIGKHKNAIDDYKLAAIYYENLGDLVYSFYTKSEIISVYGVNGFTEKTIKESLKIIEEKKAIKFTKNLAVDFFNLATNYGEIKNFKKQEEYLLKALKHYETGENENVQGADVFSGLTRYYADKNIEKAKFYLEKAKKSVLDKSKETLVYLEVEHSKALFFYNTGNLNASLNISKNILEKYKKANNIEQQIKVNNLIYKILKKQNRNKESLTYFENYTKIKDSIYSVKKTNAIAYYQTLYETEQKEKEINQQKADINILAKENAANRRLILFGSIAVLLLFLVYYSYRNRIQSDRKRKMQEEYSQKLLLSQEEERKRISKDLHDSLGQSLLLIKNKISLDSDDKTKQLVNSAIEEMRSISRVLHPFQLEDIGISKALENLIIQLDESYEKTYIFGDIEDISLMLNQNQEVNLFRIVQECLSNIIKHAQADSAKVNLINNEKHILIQIKDNGVGFDFSKKYNDFKSLGLKTIKERVKFLKGTLKIDSVKNKGTTFTIQFPTK